VGEPEYGFERHVALLVVRTCLLSAVLSPRHPLLEQQLTFSADVGLIGLAVMVSSTLLVNLACTVADVVPFYIHLSNPFYSTFSSTYHYASIQTYRVRT